MHIIPRLKPELLAIVNQMATHLSVQRARARDEGEDGEFLCRYRDKNGNMCAVGCLIPDDQRDAEGGIDHVFNLYIAAHQGDIAHDDTARFPQGKRALAEHLVSLAPTTDHRALKRFLARLQRYHDNDDNYQKLLDHNRGATNDELRVLILQGMDAQLDGCYREDWLA
jgi:hypothetical protein